MAVAMAAAAEEDTADQNDVIYRNAAAGDINTIKTGVPPLITSGIIPRFPLFNYFKDTAFQASID